MAGGATRLLGSDGSERVVTRAGEIGVDSAALRLAPPLPQTPPVGPEGEDEPEPPEPPPPPEPPYPKSPDVQFKVSLNTNLEDSGRRSAAYKLLDDWRLPSMARRLHISSCR